jgi:hypothetical protein
LQGALERARNSEDELEGRRRDIEAREQALRLAEENVRNALAAATTQREAADEALGEARTRREAAESAQREAEAALAASASLAGDDDAAEREAVEARESARVAQLEEDKAGLAATAAHATEEAERAKQDLASQQATYAETARKLLESQLERERLQTELLSEQLGRLRERRALEEDAARREREAARRASAIGAAREARSTEPRQESELLIDLPDFGEPPDKPAAHTEAGAIGTAANDDDILGDDLFADPSISLFEPVANDRNALVPRGVDLHNVRSGLAENQGLLFNLIVGLVIVSVLIGAYLLFGETILDVLRQVMADPSGMLRKLANLLLGQR